MAEKILLNFKTDSVNYLCSKDKRLAKLIAMIGEITYVPHDDGYSFLVHEIIEQMLSMKAGQKIYARLVDLCNGNVDVNTISALADSELRTIGTSKAKADCIQAITQCIRERKLCLEELSDLDDSEVIRRLTSVKGIGTWTAKMYLIFVLNRQNVLPYEDGAFLQTYRWLYKTEDTSKQAIIKKCKKWTPYSSIAARFMYRALDTGLIKEEFHLYK